MLIKIKPYSLLPVGRMYSPLPFYNFPSPQISARCHPEKTFGSHPDTASQTAPAQLIRLGSKNKQAREKLLFENFLFPCFILFFTTHNAPFFVYNTRINHPYSCFFLFYPYRQESSLPCLQNHKKLPTCYSPRYRLILFVADATASSSPTEPFR